MLMMLPRIWRGKGREACVQEWELYFRLQQECKTAAVSGAALQPLVLVLSMTTGTSDDTADAR
jgi:hypothetical protein